MTQTIVVRPAPINTPEPQRPRRRVNAVVLGGLALAGVVAVHLVLSAFMRVPIIQPDELGYLQNARFLARGGPRSETEYYPGFSLLLIPLWWVSTDPRWVFHGALVIEAVIAAVGALLVWRLAGVLIAGLAGWRRALVVALTIAYPAQLLYGNFALAEVTFATLFSAVVVIAAKAFDDRDPRWWAALGVASGALALVHPRGFAVVVAVGIFGLIMLGTEKRSLPSFGALAVGVGASLAATRWLVVITKGKVAPSFGSYRPDTVLSKSLSLHGALSLFSELAGQLWYLSLTTFGLVPLALLLGGRSLVRVVRGNRVPWVIAQGFATLCFLGVWALSSLFMNLGDRADKLIYGRYNEGVIIPLLVIALADLVRARPDRHFRASHDRAAGRRWLSTSLIAVLVTGAILQLGHSQAQLHGPLNPANVLGMASLLNRMGGHIHVITMSAIALAAIATLSAIAWRFPLVSLVAVAGVFIWITADLQTSYLVPGSQARANQDEIVDALSALAHVPGVDLSCVGWEKDKTVDYNYYNDRFLLPGQRFMQYDPAKPPGPCGVLVVSTAADFEVRYPGARVITSENFVAQSLWALPQTPTFATLDAAGYLSPPSSGIGAAVAIPAANLRGSQIDVAGGDHFDLLPRQPLELTVTVHHAPGGSPWPSVAALHADSGQYAVQIAVSFGAAPADTFNLPATLLPGQKTTFRIPLTAVDGNGNGIPPGTYQVHLGLLQQLVGSFADPGATITVTVHR